MRMAGSEPAIDRAQKDAGQQGKSVSQMYIAEGWGLDFQDRSGQKRERGKHGGRHKPFCAPGLFIHDRLNPFCQRKKVLHG